MTIFVSFGGMKAANSSEKLPPIDIPSNSFRSLRQLEEAAESTDEPLHKPYTHPRSAVSQAAHIMLGFMRQTITLLNLRAINRLPAGIFSHCA